MLHAQDLDATDYQIIGTLTSLNEIAVGKSGLSDISFARSLKNLTSLSVHHSEVANLEPLRNHPSLQVLEISGTKVETLTPVMSIRSLKHLSIQEPGHSDQMNQQIKQLRNRDVFVLDQIAILVC